MATSTNRLRHMKARTLAGVAGSIAAAALAVGMAVPAQADPDTDFANQLHTYGIYGPKDYNAWIGKITCQRLDNNVDHSATDSAAFLKKNLPLLPKAVRRALTEVQERQRRRRAGDLGR